MSLIKYEAWAPGTDARAMLRKADEICTDYLAQGFDLTLRQLYYQFVARDLIPNTLQSYKRLGDIVNRGRMAGLLDWRYIVDRTRNLRGTSHWTNPGDVINSAAYGFRLDKWVTQPRRVEVWVEKEALAGIVQRTAGRYDVDWFSCRGYVSQSEMWGAARRHFGYILNGQAVTVLHLGDHDPSGIDMTRDIRDRLRQFLDVDWFNEHEGEFDDDLDIHAVREAISDHLEGEDPIEVRRIALNMDQVRLHRPPPNPAKLTDSRADSYIAIHGTQSWELDALDPATLDQLIGSHIDGIRDAARYAAIEAQERRHRDLLTTAARRWSDVVEHLEAGR